MATLSFYAVIRNGLPEIDDPRFEDYCRGKFREGQEVSIAVRQKRKAASNQQFRYEYGVIYKMIADHTGHTIEEVDLMMKYKFLRQIDDRGLEYIPSKTEMSTVEIEEYHTKIRQWAAVALDLYIPLPNECEIPEYANVA